jgi:hypothetical protein
VCRAVCVLQKSHQIPKSGVPDVPSALRSSKADRATFVVSRVGEAFYATESAQNRNFQLGASRNRNHFLTAI